MKTVFGKTNVLLPKYASDSPDWETWSVIACDQHTSDRAYWEETRRLTAERPSTLGLILPEAYLGTELENKLKDGIASSSAAVEGMLTEYPDAMIYVERTLESGMIRRGLVGAISLDSYDYEKGTDPDVRPTEGTVKERIPPRVEVRRASTFEASHVMLFTECSEVFDLLTSSKDALRVLYDFDLMQGGGHVTGRLVSGEILERAVRIIGEYENACRSNGKMIYGVGDGNHSLASAKAYYEELKAEGKEVRGASHALVELVPISDPAIVFEPIYKAVTVSDPEGFISYLSEALEGGDVSVKCVAAYRGERRELDMALSEGKIACGVLQDAIDAYIKEFGGSCDYIHGLGDTESLADERENTVGIIFDGIEKESLFPYVSSFGVLPRKAFSMGEASEKRYYTELRRLK
ncbi:MAG: DUF1015 domain-containing protein [Clostridia bacterium]|nr:DUF1015 domain-containing protein [Clostridia bacterium]